MSNLKREAEKAQNIAFTDYVLVVSLNLTDTTKSKILKLYKGRIKRSDQIITNEDLNHLLGLPENHHIEFKFPELWMNSVSVHQKIFHLGFLKHAEFIKHKIEESLMNFVPYTTYYDLITHLNNHSIAIISGNPGVGKTTLAHAVISKFIFFHDYELIDVSYRTIREAESHLYSEKPTIFLIDDFLGEIKLDRDNDYGQLLLYFMEKVDQLINKKLILTTREYILKKGMIELSPVNDISHTVDKYIITLTYFTRRVRTQILYNHLKNSKLPSNFIDEFLKKDFKKIIDHPNYNPRVVEHLTEIKLLKEIKAENYFSFFIANLERPNKVWEMVYNNLPTDLHKLILLVRFLVKEKMSVANLQAAITEFIERSEKFCQFSYDDFEHIMNEMEGTFFVFQDGYDELVDEKYTIVEFHNPSIIDFIDGFIWKKEKWLQLIIENAIYFEQLFNWELLDIVREHPSLLKIFRSKILRDFDILTNAGFGYFTYDSADEGSFECWIPGRRNYYLSELANIIEIDKDSEITELLKREIFRYPFDGTEDISEKIAFANIAEQFIVQGAISDKKAIEHYISGFVSDLKELVFLEYMTRVCSDESLSIIRKNKELVDDADRLFVWEIESLKDKNFINVLEFYDDYEQIKHILPLKKATKCSKN